MSAELYITPIATAVTTIAATIGSIIIGFQKASERIKERLDTMEKSIAGISAGLEEQRVINKNQGADIQKLLLHDKSLSDEERLLAGQRYLKYGGNGPTGLYVSAMLKAYTKKVEKN